jgi:methylmalonyl-CoA mutase N-terminal domain/subunit
MSKTSEMKRIKLEKERWNKDVVNNNLATNPERLQEFLTESGIVVDRLYTPADIKNFDYLRDLGFPGEYPFTRGVYPTMHRGKLWTMRQISGFSTGEETNKRLKYLLSLGETGLNIVFDMPTYKGYDSDSPFAMGEVGRAGVAIDSLEDMEILFQGVPIENLSVSLIQNATAIVIMAMYIALAQKRGLSIEKLAGSIQNDILKEYEIVGTSYIFNPMGGLRLWVDLAAYCSEYMPRWNYVTLNSHCIRENGTNAVQELAFTLANAITYIEACVKEGLNVDAVVSRMSIHFSSDNNFFEEIAKLRVARRMWAKVMKERFKTKNPRSQMLRFSVQTAGRTLTPQEPENNIIRTTIQALAAVLGGAQSLHANSMDEALGIPTEKAAKIALRTQQIIAHETHVTDTVDPLGGCPYVEFITNELEKKTIDYLTKIEEEGGVLPAIEKGFFQREALAVDQKRFEDIDKGNLVVVGVNEFVTEEEISIEPLAIDPELENKQKIAVQSLRKKRDNNTVSNCLEKIRKATKGGERLMPYVIEAVKSYATLQEICDIWREEFGTYEPMVII